MPQRSTRPSTGLDVVRIADEAVHEHQGENADREVQVKNPAPAVIVGNPSAERGAENRRQQDADTEGRHGMTVTLFGEGFQKDGLSKWLQAAARQALQDAEDDQLRERGGQTAAERGQRETSDAGEQEALASNAIREPSGDWQHDGVRNQVGSDNPGAFLIRGRQAAADMRDRDVYDGGIEHLHEGRQHHRNRDDPWVYNALWMGIHANRQRKNPHSYSSM